LLSQGQSRLIEGVLVFDLGKHRRIDLLGSVKLDEIANEYIPQRDKDVVGDVQSKGYLVIVDRLDHLLLRLGRQVLEVLVRIIGAIKRDIAISPRVVFILGYRSVGKKIKFDFLLMLLVFLFRIEDAFVHDLLVAFLYCEVRYSL